jgi:hypothetical protein
MPTFETFPPLFSCGHQLEPGDDTIGPREGANDALDDREGLQERMAEKGYLLPRDLIP